MLVSFPAITAETILAGIDTFAEARAFASDMRKTALIVAEALGDDHPSAKAASDRYWAFIDEMTFKFAA